MPRKNAGSLRIEYVIWTIKNSLSVQLMFYHVNEANSLTKRAKLGITIGKRFPNSFLEYDLIDFDLF